MTTKEKEVKKEVKPQPKSNFQKGVDALNMAVDYFEADRLQLINMVTNLQKELDKGKETNK